MELWNRPKFKHVSDFIGVKKSILVWKKKVLYGHFGWELGCAPRDDPWLENVLMLLSICAAIVLHVWIRKGVFHCKSSVKSSPQIVIIGNMHVWFTKFLEISRDKNHQNWGFPSHPQNQEFAQETWPSERLGLIQSIIPKLRSCCYFESWSKLHLGIFNALGGTYFELLNSKQVGPAARTLLTRTPVKLTPYWWSPIPVLSHTCFLKFGVAWNSAVGLTYIIRNVIS